MQSCRIRIYKVFIIVSTSERWLSRVIGITVTQGWNYFLLTMASDNTTLEMATSRQNLLFPGLLKAFLLWSLVLVRSRKINCLWTLLGPKQSWDPLSWQICSKCRMVLLVSDPAPMTVQTHTLHLLGEKTSDHLLPARVYFQENYITSFNYLVIPSPLSTKYQNIQEWIRVYFYS